MKLKIIVILLFTLSCKSSKVLESKTDNTIVYIFPVSVEDSIKEELQKLDNKNVAFELQEKDNIFILYLSKSNVFWKDKTNRKIIIGEELYPLIFTLDSYFATAESKEEVIKRLKNPDKENDILRKQQSTIYDNVFMIKFERNGKILYKGSSF